MAAGTGLYASAAVGAVRSAAVPRAVPACANGTIDSWLNTTANGAAGTIYYELQLTNLSSHECSLHGFPGVSAVNFAGHQIGAPARRSGASGHAIELAAGATSKVTLGVVETGNFSVSACKPVTAFGLRVYAPNQTASDVIPWPFSVCSKSSEVSINVATVKR
jgi:hypothetical protein